MLDDIAIKVGINIFTDIFKSTYNGFTGWAIDQNRAFDVFGSAAKLYAEKIYSQYNLIRVFGMTEPIPLNEQFVHVHILKKLTSKTKLNKKKLEQLFQSDLRYFNSINKKESIPAHKIVNRYKWFIVLGKPGSGKTTFLKYLALLSLNKDTSLIKEKKIPIFINLKEFSDLENPSLIKHVIEKFEICGFPEPTNYIKRLLSKGYVRVLLDGLDEVNNEKKDKILKEIDLFTAKYNKNQYIISCRIAAYNHWFTQFTDVEIANFQDHQIEQFITNWFRKEPPIAKECWNKIKQIPALKELANLPLLLTLLCIAFDEDYDFPSSKSDLYKRAIDALLLKWDSSRRIKRDNIYKLLSIRRKESMFSRIAARTFEKSQYFLPKRTLSKYIEEYILNIPSINSNESLISAENILETIEAHHGIFVQQAKDIYSFSHLTIQEYFTSKYITENENSIKKLVSAHWNNPKWKEIFILTAGMLEEADFFFQCLLKLLKNIIIDNVVIQEINKILQKGLNLLDCNEYENRVFIFNHILSFNLLRELTINIDLDFDTDFEREMASDLASKLDTAIENNDLSLAKKILSSPYASEMTLDSDLEEIQKKYLEICSLINLDINKHNLKIPSQIKKLLFFKIDKYAFDQLKVYFQIIILSLECLNTECYINRKLRILILDSIFNNSIETSIA